MALRAVIDHPKFCHFKTLLGLNKACALGYLEALWHFTGKFTPQGNVGKYTDDQIESWIEWNGTPGALISAFIEARWIDKSNDYRLVVHDWHQHADQATKLGLKRANLNFVATVSQQCPDSVGIARVRMELNRIEQKYIPPTPRKRGKDFADIEKLVIPDSLNTEAFRTAYGRFIQARREAKKPVTATAAVEQLERMGEWGLERAIAALRHSTANNYQGVFEPPRNGSGKAPPPAPQSISAAWDAYEASQQSQPNEEPDI